MANIPLGNFAQANFVPQEQRMNVDMRALADVSGLMNIAQGLSDVSDAATQIAIQQKQQREDIAAANAKVALADHENQVQDTLKTQLDVASAPDYDLNNFDSDLKSNLDKLPVPNLPDLPPDSKILFDGALKSTRDTAIYRGQDGMRGLLKQRGESAFNTFVDTVDVQSGDVSVPLDKLYARVGSVGRDTGVSPEDIRKGQERISQGRINTIFSMAKTPEELDALSKDLRDGKYVLDQYKIGSALANAEQKKAQLINKNDADIAKHEVVAKSSVNKLQDFATSLYPTDPEVMSDLVKSTVGTPYEQQAVAAFNDYNDNRKAVTMPLGQLKAEIKGFTDLAKTTPTSDAPYIEKSVAFKNKIFNDRLAIAMKTPIDSIESETGQTFEKINWTDPNVATAQIQERMKSVKTYQQTSGVSGIPLNPFNADDQTEVLSLITNAPDAMRTTLVKSIAKASDSPLAYRYAMASVKQNSPVNFYAGELFMKPSKEVVGDDLMKKFYAGEKIRKENTKVLPSDQALTAEFATRMGNSIAPDTDEYKNGLEAFKRLYANDAPTESTFTEDAVASKAFSLATGGVTDWGNNKVVTPWGLTDEEFIDKAIENIRRVNVEFNLGIDEPDKVDLHSIPNNMGEYYMVGDDGYPMLDKNNRLIKIKVSNK